MLTLTTLDVRCFVEGWKRLGKISSDSGFRINIWWIPVVVAELLRPAGRVLAEVLLIHRVEVPRICSIQHAANRRLADTAYGWAMAAIQHDDVSRAKYDALRSRCHNRACILRSVADRFLGVVCKVIETGQTRDPERGSMRGLCNPKKA